MLRVWLSEIIFMVLFLYCIGQFAEQKKRGKMEDKG